MAEISRRAGVGMATLYRNFPGRRELLEALYTDEVNAVCKAAETVDGETPGAVLTAWLHRFFAFVTSKRHIASELLEHTDRSNPLFDNSRARVIAAGRPLLAAAQRAHEVRDDARPRAGPRHGHRHRHDPRRHPLPRTNPPDRTRRPSPPADVKRREAGAHPGTHFRPLSRSPALGLSASSQVSASRCNRVVDNGGLAPRFGRIFPQEPGKVVSSQLTDTFSVTDRSIIFVISSVYCTVMSLVLCSA